MVSVGNQGKTACSQVKPTASYAQWKSAAHVWRKKPRKRQVTQWFACVKLINSTMEETLFYLRATTDIKQHNRKAYLNQNSPD